MVSSARGQASDAVTALVNGYLLKIQIEHATLRKQEIMFRLLHARAQRTAAV